VEAGEHADFAGADREKQAIRKAPKASPANLALNDLKLHRVIGKALFKRFEFLQETVSRTWRLRPVPIVRICKLGLSGRRQANPH